MGYRIWISLALFFVVAFSSSALAQDTRPRDDEDAEEEMLYTDEQQAAIKELFHADVIGFTPNGVRLMYFFSTQKEDPLKDWTPPIEKTKKRVRWPVTSDNASGLVFSDNGINISGEYLQTNAEVGYVVVDFDVSDDFDLSRLEALKQIDGTLRARIVQR